MTPHYCRIFRSLLLAFGILAIVLVSNFGPSEKLSDTYLVAFLTMAVLFMSAWFVLFPVENEAIPQNKEYFGFPVPESPLSERLAYLDRVVESQEREMRERYLLDDGTWRWEAYPKERLVVCSAVKYGKLIIPSVRHTSVDRWTMVSLIGLDALQAYHGNRSGEQGFLDQWSRFMSREEAYQVAVISGQIDPDETPQPDTLFSEDIWP